ncbi:MULTISPECIES: hypothetical protein [Neobacillus]|uniref:Uncharacterized protein n=1 Tax=Neobacillus rhizophilus TaxID=2833579 RepID=A0A942U8H5_9BACI|nr:MULTISPECIES: hypothetical protein [Neobacillus]MBS4213409.1 hypothetical protein [Neobacillus rhizophilus]MBU8914479.1 hypothetical protein [Bacillus sp. FJAT-29953]
MKKFIIGFVLSVSVLGLFTFSDNGKVQKTSNDVAISTYMSSPPPIQPPIG